MEEATLDLAWTGKRRWGGAPLIQQIEAFWKNTQLLQVFFLCIAPHWLTLGIQLLWVVKYQMEQIKCEATFKGSNKCIGSQRNYSTRGKQA